MISHTQTLIENAARATESKCQSGNSFLEQLNADDDNAVSIWTEYTTARCTTLRTTNHMSRLTHVLGTHVAALIAPLDVVSFIFFSEQAELRSTKQSVVSQSQCTRPYFLKTLEIRWRPVVRYMEHTLRKEHLYVKHEEAGPGG